MIVSHVDSPAIMFNKIFMSYDLSFIFVIFKFTVHVNLIIYRIYKIYKKLKNACKSKKKNVKINLQNLQIENMSQLNLKIGPKIKAFRRQLGLQANKLAEELDISPSYLNLIEGGKEK